MLLYQAWHVASGNFIAEFDDEVLAADFVARQAEPEQWLIIPNDPDEDEEPETEEPEEDV